MRRLAAMEKMMAGEALDQQISITDPDSRFDGDQRARLLRSSRLLQRCRSQLIPIHHLVITTSMR